MKEVSKERQGLYRQEFEHDNCGIGAVVNIKGKKIPRNSCKCTYGL